MATDQTKMGPITDLHQEYGLFGPYVLTKRGSLIGAVELSGRDPDGLLPIDYQGLSWIARNVYQHYGDEVITTQYYAHYDGAQVRLRDRSHPISSVLSRRRERFLNSKRLTSSRLVHFFEIPPSEALSRLTAFEFLKHLGGALVRPASREALKRSLSATHSIVCYVEELQRQKLMLDQIRSDTVDKWTSILDARLMSTQETWAFMRFLANMDPRMLSGALDEQIPDEGWDLTLSESDVAPISVHGMDALALRGETTKYVRLCSITQFGGRDLTAGLWASSASAPVRQNRNFVLMTRFAPYTNLQRAMLFRSKEQELNRRNFDFMNAIRGVTSGEGGEKQAAMKPAIAERLKELGEAELVDDIWGMSTACLATFDTNPARLRETCTALKNSANKSGLHVCWESVGLGAAWKTFMPAGRHHSKRDIPITTTQFGNISLLYRSSTGQTTVADLEGEESQYVFLSADGTPFYFSPFVGGRAVVFGVGPIRSGKSFLKNAMASHFLKYGEGSLSSLFRALDIDPGTEPVAQSFGEDGAIFRIDRSSNRTRGFNPFAACRGPEDDQFAAHMRSQIIRMMATNDNIELQTPSADEQHALDNAIYATMRLPKSMQRLSTVASHCPQDLRMKMSRWIHDPVTKNPGMYAYLMDAAQDAIGGLSTRVAVFNLAGVKDDPVALPIVMAELFYRIKRSFEDEALRPIPKFLDVDEAHALLAIPSFAKESDTFIRTCGKWRAGIAFWSQSPREFGKLESWPALRSAASTFIFMADPGMDEKLYRETFMLTPGECEAIRRLTPKREAYIVQREIGVSKKVILEVEPEQYVICTSQAREASIRRENFEKYGFEIGLQRTMQDLGLVKESNVTESDTSSQSTPPHSSKEVA